MLKRKFPPGFIVPAQPVERDKPPAGPDWVHEIKHDGYRLIVRRDGETVRFIHAQGQRLDAGLSIQFGRGAALQGESFTIDGEAVVIGLTVFRDLTNCAAERAPGAAFLYAFDFLEHDGEDLRELPFLDPQSKALARLLAERGRNRVQ